MPKEDIRTATLEEIRAMKDRGELLTVPNPPVHEEPYPDGFWDDAVIVPPMSRSVHLRLDGEVFDWFRTHGGGKGHITHMQRVLAAYVKAQKAAAAKAGA